MTFKEFIEKLLDEISSEKSLTFEKANEFVERIGKLKYSGGDSLSIEDQIVLVEMLNDGLKKRGYSVKAIIRDSTNSSTVTAISKMLNQIKAQQKGDKK